MTTYSADDLRQVLELHRRWLNGEDSGQRANLRGADLGGADLSGADLRGADLGGADLRGANLRGADLCGAYLSGADLRGANLGGADLRGANLRGADLRCANLGGQPLLYASCSWTAHGECGRTLTGIAMPDESGAPRLQLSCGCFCGTAQELREYIARGEERYRTSRTTALEFVVARMAEMGVDP